MCHWLLASCCLIAHIFIWTMFLIFVKPRPVGGEWGTGGSRRCRALVRGTSCAANAWLPFFSPWILPVVGTSTVHDVRVGQHKNKNSRRHGSVLSSIRMHCTTWTWDGQSWKNDDVANRRGCCSFTMLVFPRFFFNFPRP